MAIEYITRQNHSGHQLLTATQHFDPEAGSGHVYFSIALSGHLLYAGNVGLVEGRIEINYPLEAARRWRHQEEDARLAAARAKLGG